MHDYIAFGATLKIHKNPNLIGISSTKSEHAHVSDKEFSPCNFLSNTSKFVIIIGSNVLHIIRALIYMYMYVSGHVIKAIYMYMYIEYGRVMKLVGSRSVLVELEEYSSLSLSHQGQGPTDH